MSSTHGTTTATAVRKIKLAARSIQRDGSLSLSAALDRAAQEAGYNNFHHVTVCAKSCKESRLPPLRFAISPPTFAGLVLPGDPQGEFYLGPDVERLTDQLDRLMEDLDMDSFFAEPHPAELKKLAEACSRWINEVPLFLDGHAHVLYALCELNDPSGGVDGARAAFDAAYQLIPNDFCGFISQYRLDDEPYYRLGENLAIAYRRLKRPADARSVEGRLRKFARKGK